MTITEKISEINPEAQFSEEFKKCLIGYVERFGMEPVALYDRAAVVAQLARDEAEEYLEFNPLGAWVGAGTPAFATILRRPR